MDREQIRVRAPAALDNDTLISPVGLEAQKVAARRKKFLKNW